MTIYYIYVCVFCSHERVLEAITEEAEKREIERFQPLLAGMNNQNIALKVHTQMQSCTLLVVNPGVFYSTQSNLLCKRPAQMTNTLFCIAVSILS